jgi:hypothetical protein
MLKYMSVRAYMLGDKSLMKLRFVLTHRVAVLHEKTFDRPSRLQHLIVMFIRKYQEISLCWHNI